jgi:hypothetical protein
VTMILLLPPPLPFLLRPPPSPWRTTSGIISLYPLFRGEGQRRGIVLIRSIVLSGSSAFRAWTMTTLRHSNLVQI